MGKKKLVAKSRRLKVPGIIVEDAQINKRLINMSRFSIKLMYVFRLVEHAYNENCEA